MCYSNNRKLSIFLFVLIIFTPIITLAQALDTTVYQEVCSIRKMFCGGAALAVAMTAILAIGFMAFMGKANMGILLVTTIGLVIFISADLLFEAFFTPPAGAEGVVQACSCK